MERTGISQRRPITAHRPRWPFVTACIVLTGAIVFGGGGTPAPGMELVVELIALVALVVYVWFDAIRGGANPARDWPLVIMLALLPTIAIVQLIPLPPSIWYGLPFRQVEIDALRLVDSAHQWMPVSLIPSRTLSALLSLIAPLILAWMTMKLNLRDRTLLLFWLGILGVVSAIAGALQLASGNEHFLRLYRLTQYGFATGFQASRNAEADVLLLAAMAMLGAVAVLRRKDDTRRYLIIGIAGLLVIATSLLLTGSRAGIALASIVMIISVAMFVPIAKLRTRKVMAACLLGIVALGALGYAAQYNSRINRVFSRYENSDSIRPMIWKDSTYTLKQYWPAGSGVGSFQTVFPAMEQLDFVRPSFANRAHNDFLEFGIETGVIGIAYIIAIIVFLVARTIYLLRLGDNRERFVHLAFVHGVLAVILLHSLVDYPLRSMSTACIAGLAAGLLAKPTLTRGRRQPSPDQAQAA